MGSVYADDFGNTPGKANRRTEEFCATDKK
jgi:hypothetical protein